MGKTMLYNILIFEHTPECICIAIVDHLVGRTITHDKQTAPFQRATTTERGSASWREFCNRTTLGRNKASIPYGN